MCLLVCLFGWLIVCFARPTAPLLDQHLFYSELESVCLLLSASCIPLVGRTEISQQISRRTHVFQFGGALSLPHSPGEVLSKKVPRNQALFSLSLSLSLSLSFCLSLSLSVFLGARFPCLTDVSLVRCLGTFGTCEGDDHLTLQELVATNSHQPLKRPAFSPTAQSLCLGWARIGCLDWWFGDLPPPARIIK